MRILIIINSLAVGGAERLITDTLPRFVKSGLDVELLLLVSDANSLENELNSKGIVIHRLKAKNIYNPFLIFRILKFLPNYDLIHVHLFPSLYWTAFAKILLVSKKIKLIYTEHSTSNKRRGKFLLRQADRVIYSHFDKIIAISSEVCENLISHLGGGSAKFEVIENGIDLRRFSSELETTKTSDRNQDEFYLIQIARLTPEKDYETLLRAVPLVNHKIKLFIVGMGPMESVLKSLVQELRIVDRVEFLGVRHDIPELLQNSDLAILSSHHEGLSIAALEKMASGIPLVASKVPGLTTLVHGAGVLFEHKDHLDLAEKINELIENPEHYKRVAEACLERSKKYSLEKMVDAHIKLYKELCQNPS